METAVRDHLAASKRADSHVRTAIQIGFVALVIRLLIAWLAFWNANPAVVLWPRGIEVLAIAKSLATGSGFSSPFVAQTGPTAFMPPVYPYILAVVLKFFGNHTRDSAWVIVCLQSLFSAGTCVPVYLLAVRDFGVRTGRFAAWIWALLPYTAIIPTNIIWETCLSALLVSIGVLLIFRASERTGIQRWVLAAVFWALAALTNASLLPLFPAYALLTLIWGKARAGAWRAFASAVATFGLCLAPWIVRNFLVMHDFIPVRSNFALELWIGNRDGAEPGFHPEIHPAFNAEEVNRYASMGELGYMADKRYQAMGYIRANPEIFLWNTLVRIFRFWTGGLNGLFYGVTLLNVTGFAGFFLLARRHPKQAAMYGLPLLVYPLPFYITHADIRYEHPIQPLLVVLAASALCSRREGPSD